MNARTAPTDRRASQRLPIEQEVHYRVHSRNAAGITACGQTVNISSSGVLFSTEQALLPGRSVELNITWPAQLDKKCALKLVAQCRVVRCQDGRAAVEIVQHEFRTRSSAAALRRG